MNANNFQPPTPPRARGINGDRGLERPHFYRAVLGQNPCRALEVAPGHGLFAALLFPAGTPAAQVAGRLYGNSAGTSAASYSEMQPKEVPLCL
jgi:hypothetical protein